MSGWNYRVVKILLINGRHDFAVHEVYYDALSNPNSLTANDVSPTGERKSSFLKSLAMWKKALEKPVLVYDDLANKFVGEEPPLVTTPAPPRCECGREMSARVEWVCPVHGEEFDL